MKSLFEELYSIYFDCYSRAGRGALGAAQAALAAASYNPLSQWQ